MAKEEENVPTPDQVADQSVEGNEPTSLGDAAPGVVGGGDILGADRQDPSATGGGGAGAGPIEQDAMNAIRDIQQKRDES